MCMKPGYMSDVAYQISGGKGSIIQYMVLVETSITHNTKPNIGENLYNRMTGKVFLNKTRRHKIKQKEKAQIMEGTSDQFDSILKICAKTP